jgi:hypothetical protein
MNRSFRSCCLVGAECSTVIMDGECRALTVASDLSQEERSDYAPSQCFSTLRHITSRRRS